jgi:hypothetical protein
MRANRTSGSMRGCWRLGTVELVRHRQTKGAGTDRLDLLSHVQYPTLPPGTIIVQTTPPTQEVPPAPLRRRLPVRATSIRPILVPPRGTLVEQTSCGNRQPEHVSLAPGKKAIFSIQQRSPVSSVLRLL